MNIHNKILESDNKTHNFTINNIRKLRLRK